MYYCDPVMTIDYNNILFTLQFTRLGCEASILLDINYVFNYIQNFQSPHTVQSFAPTGS